MSNRISSRRALRAAAAAAGSVLLGACALLGMGGAVATADLEPRSGSGVAGSLSFVQKGSQVRVVGDISGLSPGEHGFHVHEHGDCSAADATSAGGHFNPDSAPHGRPGMGLHHAGDIANIRADANGVAHVHVVLNDVAVSSTERNGIVGRAIVVHRDPDDYRTQPAGNSGPRVACGVIRAGAR